MPNLYKLQSDAKPAELGGPPFIFGSALRVPSIAYPSWNIKGNPYHLRELSLTTYQDEFGDTSTAWMESVVEAAKRGGIGDRPNMLRKAVAEVAAELTEARLRKQGRVRVLDVGCGAGGSLNAYLDALHRLKPDYAERVDITGADLSRGSLWAAEDSLVKRSFVPGKNMRIIHSRDFELPAHVDRETQDIVINVAGIHACSYLGYPISAISYALIGGGHFVSADWHHGRWLHPSWTYVLLEEMDEQQYEWTNKGAVLDEFRTMFPKATEGPDLSWTTEADLVAIEEIAKYWRDGWSPVRLEKIREGKLKPTDEQIVAEGHRPHEEYIRECGRHRLHNVREPKQVVPGSNLNMLLVSRKE